MTSSEIIEVMTTYSAFTANCSALAVPNGDPKGLKCGKESNWWIGNVPVCTRCMSIVSKTVWRQSFKDFLAEFIKANPHMFPSKCHSDIWMNEQLKEADEQ